MWQIRCRRWETNKFIAVENGWWLNKTNFVLQRPQEQLFFISGSQILSRQEFQEHVVFDRHASNLFHLLFAWYHIDYRIRGMRSKISLSLTCFLFLQQFSLSSNVTTITSKGARLQEKTKRDQNFVPKSPNFELLCSDVFSQRFDRFACDNFRANHRLTQH